MSKLSGVGTFEPERRRRSDAQRSVAAIVDAAATVFTQNPLARMEDVALAAGLTRQTVYAHFPSRDALIAALTDRATDRVLATLDAADLDSMRPREALVRLVQISWEEIEAAAYLLSVPDTSSPEEEQERHGPILEHLYRIIERGQRLGVFDPKLPPEWIAAATIALGHATGAQVRAARMTMAQASAILARTLPRLFAAADS